VSFGQYLAVPANFAELETRRAAAHPQSAVQRAEVALRTVRVSKNKKRGATAIRTRDLS